MLVNEINSFCNIHNKEFKLQSYETIVRPIFTSKNINNKFLEKNLTLI